MAVITKGWLTINRTYPREKVEELVNYMIKRDIRLVMIGNAVSQPEDLLNRWSSGDVTIDARIFIENEEDAMFFALKYV